MRFPFWHKKTALERFEEHLPWHMHKPKLNLATYLILIFSLGTLAVSLLFLKSFTEFRDKAAPSSQNSRRLMLELTKDPQGNIKVNRVIPDPKAPSPKVNPKTIKNNPSLIHNAISYPLVFTPPIRGEDFMALGLPQAQSLPTQIKVETVPQTAYVTLNYTPGKSMVVIQPHSRPKSIDPKELDQLLPNLENPPILGASNSPKGKPTLDILFISDKYTSENKFKTDAQTIFDFMLTIKPFSSYTRSINLVTLYVPQGVGCFRHPDNNSLILCDVLTIYDTARGQTYDEIIVLEDSNVYGGSGLYDHIAAVYSDTNDWAKEVAVHEFGHSFGGLGDEYDLGYYFSEQYPPPWPNCDFGSCSKWLPHNEAGCFSVCGATNLFRPTFNSSVMRTLTPEGGLRYGPISEEVMLGNLLDYITDKHDLNHDFVVDWRDLLTLNQSYDLPTACASTLDLNGDCLISLFDFSFLASYLTP